MNDNDNFLFSYSFPHTLRFWKKVFVKLTDTGCLQLFNNRDDKDPFQELPLQACYSVSDIGKRLQLNGSPFYLSRRNSQLYIL